MVWQPTPARKLNWNEAQAFCESRGAWLPTEAEWEYAARGPEGWAYPWGNEFAADNVVYEGNSGGQTAEVGSRPGGMSWVGALDLSGNVWEWVADWSGTYGPGPQVNPAGPGSGENRVVRGGAWGGISNLRAALRHWTVPSYHFNYVGFRCARS